MNTLSSLLKFIGVQMGTLRFDLPSTSALPVTIVNENITDKHVCVGSRLSNPYAQQGQWTVTTSEGQAVISGSISGTTDLTVYLDIQTN